MNAKQMLAKLDGYGGIIPFNSEELEVTLRALRLLAAAEAGDGSTPVAWVRMRDGKIDWAEDCLGSSEDDIHAEEYDDEDGITAAPLYSQDSINGLAARVGELEQYAPLDIPRILRKGKD